MSFVEAEHLFTQTDLIRAVRIQYGRSEILTIINCVDRCQGVSRRDGVVKPNRAEVVANGLRRAAEDLCNAAGDGYSVHGASDVEVGGSCRRARPQIEQRLDARIRYRSRIGVGYEGHRRLV